MNRIVNSLSFALFILRYVSYPNQHEKTVHDLHIMEGKTNTQHEQLMSTESAEMF